MSIYLLRKLQVNVMSPRTALKQVPIRARLFYHLCVHCITPCVIILPVTVVRHRSCKKWLFARISFRAGIGGRGAGEFVKSERERKSCNGSVETALFRMMLVSKTVSLLGVDSDG